MIIKLNLLPTVDHFEKLKILKGHNLWGIIAERLMFHQNMYFSRKVILLFKGQDSLYELHIVTKSYGYSPYWDEPEALLFYLQTREHTDYVNNLFDYGINFFNFGNKEVLKIEFFNQERKRKWSKEHAIEHLEFEGDEEVYDYYNGLHHVLITFNDNSQLRIYPDRGLTYLELENNLAQNFDSHYYDIFDLDLSLTSKILDQSELLASIFDNDERNKCFKLYYEI